MKAASRFYDVSFGDDILKLRDREAWNKPPTSLDDYVAPFGDRPREEWRRLVAPRHSFHHLAIRRVMPSIRSGAWARSFE